MNIEAAIEKIAKTEYRANQYDAKGLDRMCDKKLEQADGMYTMMEILTGMEYSEIKKMVSDRLDILEMRTK